MKNAFSMKWFTMLAWAVLMLMPSLAMAQQTGYELDENDLARKTFIEPLFGPLVDSNLASPLTNIIMMFNTALLFVAGILVAYTIVSGVMSTAHDGEMMGKKWSAMWIPIRTSLGAALILPVVGGGWSVIQVIVIWLAMQGAGLANNIWESFIGNAESIVIGANYNPPQNLLAVKDLYGDMLVSSACVAGRNSQVDGTFFGGDKYVKKSKVIPKGPFVDERWLVNYGEEWAATMEYERACGYVVVQENTKPEDISDGASTTLSREILDLSKIKPEIAVKRRALFEEASDRLFDMGGRIYAGTASQKDVDDLMNELMEKYSREMSAVASSTYKDAVNTDFLKMIAADGFVNAGAFYMQITKAQDQVTGMITAPVASAGGNVLHDQATSVPVFYIAEMRKGTLAATKMVSQWRAESSNATMAIGESEDSIGSKLVSWFMSRDNEGIFGTAARANSMDPNQNPILMAKGVGDSMVTAAWSGLTLAAAGGTIAAVATGNIVGNLAGAAEAFSFLKDLMIPVFMVIFSSLLVPGAILSTYLPLMPYILWLGVIFGWAVLLIEAVIAAPLWAVAHIAPDGDGIVGRGGQGYMLVLSLILRPPLMVIGLVASIVLMKPIGILVNSTFLGAFVMAVDNPGLGSLTSGIAGLFIYMIVMIMIIQRVFALIHIIPDRLLRWIGGGGSELGQEAEQLGTGAWAKSSAAIGSAMTVSQASQSGIGNAMAGARQRAETNETRKQGEAQRAQNDLANLRRDDSRAHAAEGKAMSYDTVGGPNSARAEQMRSAASQYMAVESAANQTAVSSARVDTNEEAQAFNQGLQKTQTDGDPNSETQFMQEQSEAALARVKAYDNDPANNPAPRPFQRALAEAAVARNRAATLRAQANNLPDESIRQSKMGNQSQPDQVDERDLPTAPVDDESQDSDENPMR